MGNGKKAKAPCGHDGEHVVGTYVRCLEGCDGSDDDDLDIEVHYFDLEEATPKMCPHCNSIDVQPYSYGGITALHCVTCGRVFS